MEYQQLLLPLTERMVIIWFAAYIFSQTALFWNVVKDTSKTGDYIRMIAFFSMLSIAGTYLGIPLTDGAIANIRPLGAIVAGIIGGPWVGAAVGIVSGAHRWHLGGITGVACGIATVAEGVAGGFVRRINGNNFLNLKVAILAGVLGEVAQVIIVLLSVNPFSVAWSIERVAAVPMIIVNTIGVVGFIYIIRDVYQKHNGMIVTQFNRFVDIQRELSVLITKGVTAEAAGDIINTFTYHTKLKSIFFIKENRLLGYRGVAQEIEDMARELSKSGKLSAPRVIQLKNRRSAVRYYCVPITTFEKEQTVLGVEITGRSYYDPYIMEFSQGLVQLIEDQIKRYQFREIEHQMVAAQLKALKAQIQPHFLFNALSTISSFCRTNGTKARELILDLSNYFRKTIESEGNMVPLEDELKLIRSYLRIEEARFGERLKLHFEIAPGVETALIPTLVIQPLIENAIKHGILVLENGGNIWVVIKTKNKQLIIEVINEGNVGKVNDSSEGCGQALENIRTRLELLYGTAQQFKLDCTDPYKTRATLCMPLTQEEGDLDAVYHY